MFLAVLAGSIFAIVLVGLGAGAFTIRHRQHTLSAQREAAQLQRRADHLFIIALAAQMHTRNDAIARALLNEAVRVLEYSTQLDPAAELTANLLRACREVIANIDSEPKQPLETHNPTLEFPETELIEAQLHLIEASRLLIGLEKRGQINYDALSEMTIALKQAQRAIDLRLQLQQAAHAIDADHNTPKRDEARAGEYLSALERNPAQPPH